MSNQRALNTVHYLRHRHYCKTVYFRASYFRDFGTQKFCCILIWCFPSVLLVFTRPLMNWIFAGTVYNFVILSYSRKFEHTKNVFYCNAANSLLGCHYRVPETDHKCKFSFNSLSLLTLIPSSAVCINSRDYFGKQESERTKCSIRRGKKVLLTTASETSRF